MRPYLQCPVVPGIVGAGTMGFIRRHLTYGNVVVTLALVLAMSGGALAATRYLVNSTKQVNPTVLKALKGNVGSSGHDGATGAIGATGPQGQSGLTGPTGPQGNEGSPGPAGATGRTGGEGPRGPAGPQGPEGGSVGEWTALTLSGKVRQVSGYEEAAARTESAGATARLRGVLEITSEVKAGEPIFTLPAAYRPKSKIELGFGVSSTSGTNHVGSLLIYPNGLVIDPEPPAPTGIYYLLDGITWNLE